MTDRYDGGLAFPGRRMERFAADEDQKDPTMHLAEYGGMTLEDYFAGQALMGYIAGPHLQEIHPVNTNWDFLSEVAYSAAAAMVAQKEKRRAQS